MQRFGKTTLLTYLLAVLALVLLFGSFLPQQAQAADTDRYGYQQLESDKLKQLYVLIVDALADCKDNLSLSGKGYRESDLTAAAEMVRRDYPEFFYYTNYSYSFSSGGILQSVEFKYMLDGKEVKGNSSELKSARTAFDKRVKEIVKGAKGTDYQKALYLHDYIVNSVTYKTTSNDQNAYGALMEGKAVCAGYSHAYQLLLREVGIESFYITGTSRNIPHAWLVVFLNDECYYTDVTWDDSKTADGHEILGHYYFDMSYDDISKDHISDAEYDKWLPKKHDHKDMYYFEQEAREGSGIGWFNSKTSPKKLYDYMKKDGNTYYCDFRYDGDDVENWLNEAFQNVADQVGEIGISYVQLGNEYMLTITAKASEHELRKVSAKAPTCTAEGNKEYYECTKCGKRFSDPEAKTWLNNDSCVVIEKLGHTDGNGDKRCDTCGYKMSGSSSTTTTTPTTPPVGATEATTPPTDATEGTTPPTDTTEGTTPPTDATEGTTPSVDATEETTPPTDATEGTTPSTDATEGTTPSAGATEGTIPSGDAADPTDPTQGKPSDGDEPMNTTWIIVAGAGIAAVAVIAAATAVIRKKRVS